VAVESKTTDSSKKLTPNGGGETTAEPGVSANFQGTHLPPREEPSVSGADPDRAGLMQELVEKIRGKLGSDLPEAVQTELAALLGLAPEATESSTLCPCQFEIAADALLASSPKLELARGLRMQFEEQMWAKRFGGRFLKALPTTRVVFGLLVTSLLLLPPLIWSAYKHFTGNHPDARLDMDFLVLACCFGAFGAVTSIMVRLRSFDSIHAPPFTMFLTGLFKPFIGAFFAAFALVLAESRLINLPDETLVYFVLAIAFVAGFSERFGEDLTKVVANKVSPPRQKHQAEASN